MFSYFDDKRLQRARRSVFMIVQNGVLNDSRVLKTAQSVRKLGYRVTLFGVHGKRHVETLEYSTFTIKLLPNPRIRLKDEDRWQEDINARDHAAYDRIAAEQILPFVHAQRPDVLHTHDMIGLAVGAALREQGALEGVRWVHDIHEYVAGLDIAPRMQAHYEALEAKAIAWPDALSTVSPTLGALLQREQKLTAPPWLVLNTPRLCDFDPHLPTSVRAAAGICERQTLMVYSGGVKAVRGVDMIIDALRDRQEDYLAIITDSRGPDVDALSAKASALNVQARVQKLPYVPFMNVTSFLRDASVGIHPIRRYPNAEIALPNKLFEYIHAGLPVVTSDNPTMTDFIEREGCGTTFALDDPSTLAERIGEALELAKAPGFQDRLHDTARRHCWEEQEMSLAAIYEEIDPCVATPKAARPSAADENERPPRVLQLPLPQAGQAATLANGLRAEGIDAKSMSIRPNAFGYQCDINIDLQSPNIQTDRSLIHDLARDYDIFHFHVRSLFYRQSYSYGTGFDLMMLRFFGRKIFYQFRGSEIRMASVFKRHSRYAYAGQASANVISKPVEAKQRAFRDYVQAVCHGVLVTDPELQTSVPEAVIVPRALNLDDWSFVGTHKSDRLKVVHAPSNRVTKGTDAVLAAVDRLISEGHNIDFQLVEKLSHDEARKVYKEADIIIDQLRIGWYGVLAVEAMALGKAVVTYIRDDLRHYLPDPRPLEIANPDNLYQVLRGLLDDRDKIATLGERARAYAEDVHDARKIARFLKMIYADFDTTVGDPTHIHDFLKLQLVKKPKAKAVRQGSATKTASRVRHLMQCFEPTYHLGLFVQTWRREGADKAFKRTMAFLRER